MKLISFANLTVVALILTAATPGCHKRPEDLTRIPGYTENPNVVDDTRDHPDKGPGNLNTNDNLVSYPVPDPTNHLNWIRDSEIFKSDTVHFAFDSSVVRNDQKAKVADVAKNLKANPAKAVEVEGHCDERGTAEYNRALGERRALAVREELIRLGIDPSRIDTITYGFDRPVDTGHTDAAWSKNRRGEFILLTAPPDVVRP
jgi:peptidoglycan-associated lipoprotein